MDSSCAVLCFLTLSGEWFIWIWMPHILCKLQIATFSSTILTFSTMYNFQVMPLHIFSCLQCQWTVEKSWNDHQVKICSTEKVKIMYHEAFFFFFQSKDLNQAKSVLLFFSHSHNKQKYDLKDCIWWWWCKGHKWTIWLKLYHVVNPSCKGVLLCVYTPWLHPTLGLIVQYLLTQVLKLSPGPLIISNFHILITNLIILVNVNIEKYWVQTWKHRFCVEIKIMIVWGVFEH